MQIQFDPSNEVSSHLTVFIIEQIKVLAVAFEPRLFLQNRIKPKHELRRERDTYHSCFAGLGD